LTSFEGSNPSLSVIGATQAYATAASALAGSCPSHRSADSDGMKKYSPPRRTLKVWMPWMRRLTGSRGIVNVAPSC
jgi:hypothetical protein